MLGVNWKKKKGVDPYGEHWSLFLVRVRLIILLTSVERQSWMCCAHECQSLKHRGEKGMDEASHLLQVPEGLHAWESLFYCSVLSHPSWDAQFPTFYAWKETSEVLLRKQELWGRQLWCGCIEVAIWPLKSILELIYQFESLGYKAGFLPHTTTNLAFSWNLSRAALVGLDST